MYDVGLAVVWGGVDNCPGCVYGDTLDAGMLLRFTADRNFQERRLAWELMRLLALSLFGLMGYLGARFAQGLVKMLSHIQFIIPKSFLAILTLYLKRTSVALLSMPSLSHFAYFQFSFRAEVSY